jgi:outer membrane immunogenic protein
MRKFLIGSVAFLGLTTAASAADYRAAPPPVPVFSWTGFYVGLNAGGIWADGNFREVCNSFDPLPFAFECHRPFASLNRDESGWLAGGQIGYNYQFRGWGGGSWVFGAEADLQYSNLTRTGSFFGSPLLRANPALGPFELTYRASADMDWFGTVRGRLGFAWDRLLVYGTGGLIFANISTSHFVNEVPLTAAGFGFGPAGATSFTSIATHDSIVPGWIAGGGIEYAFWNNVSLKVEGMYYELNDTHAGGRFFFNNNILQPFAGQRGQTDVQTTGWLVRGGINWRFWGM